LAGFLRRAADRRWSSAHAHLGLTADDGLTATAPVMDRTPDLAARIESGEDEAMSLRLRRAETIGRPLGDAAFVAGLERRTGRTLAPARRGPKPKRRENGAES
jgi:putative transposase